MEQNELKQVKEVFKDYRTVNKELLEARIESMNLFKKTNSLELDLLVTQEIKIRDIASFEKYIQSRFGIKSITTKIKFQKDKEEIRRINIARIEKEWVDIIEYISNKHPMTKAILNNSKILIDGNAANVILSFKGKEFLVAKKYDEILENLLQDIYGEKYKVSYIEEISEDVIKRKQAYAEEMQKQAILEVQRQAIVAEADEILQEQEKRKSNINDIEMQESEISQDNTLIEDKDIYDEEEYLQELNIILGTLSKAKENKVKIKDIEASNKRITIEGRIVSCEARETKTGKGMIIYDIYDGSGIITCKSFTKNIEEGNQVVQKLKNASGIKTIGKAGLDSFAGDVTIMANTIIEINGDDFPKLPTEDVDSPLILGMSVSIKEPLVKIQDLSTESGNVAIDGEVIAMEPKELKSRKSIT